MSTMSQAYDHPTYEVRYGANGGVTTAGAATAGARFNAFTAMKAYNAVLTVQVAGTSATHAYVIQKISGTDTTALGTATMSTKAANTVVTKALSATAGGVDLAQGDVLRVLSTDDVAGTAVVTYEVSVAPGASLTA
jgi:hypothetical protein